MPSDKVVRFGGSMQDVIKQFEAGSTDAFDTIIDQIQDEETSMIKFNKFLVEIGDCAPLFTAAHKKLVKSLLKSNWATAHPTVLANWKKTILSLLSANNVHVSNILEHCVKSFVYG